MWTSHLCASQYRWRKSMLVARSSQAPQPLELLRDSKLLPIRPMAGMLVVEAPPLAVCRILSVETITLRTRGTGRGHPDGTIWIAAPGACHLGAQQWHACFHDHTLATGCSVFRCAFFLAWHSPRTLNLKLLQWMTCSAVKKGPSYVACESQVVLNSDQHGLRCSGCVSMCLSGGARGDSPGSAGVYLSECWSARS